jgi:hypothetical protein
MDLNLLLCLFTDLGVAESEAGQFGHLFYLLNNPREAAPQFLFLLFDF